MSQSYDSYFYGNEAEQYTFYRLPKVLFTEERYKVLSDGAKILYGLMLDRMGLSIKNRWLDEQDRVYIYFTLEDVLEYMNCKRDKGMKMLAELDTEKGVGLIERIRQGLGKPAIIYVKKFINTTDFKKSEKPTSGLPVLPTSASRKSSSPKVGKIDPNNNNYINTDFNNIDFSDNQSIYQGDMQEKTEVQKEIDRIDGYRELLKENIDFDFLLERYPFQTDVITEVLEIMVDAVTSKKDYLSIGQEDKPTEIVKSVLLKLDFNHIEYVMDCLKNNTTKIYNIRAYLLTALYRAPSSIGNYYQAEVKHDMSGGKFGE